MIKKNILHIGIMLLISSVCIAQNFHVNFVFCDTIKLSNTGQILVNITTINFDSINYIIKGNHDFGNWGKSNKTSIILNGEYYTIDSIKHSIIHFIKGQPTEYNLRQTKHTEMICGIKCVKYLNQIINSNYNTYEELWISDKFGTNFHGGPASYFAEGYGVILKRSAQQTCNYNGDSKISNSNMVALSVSDCKIDSSEFVVPNWPIKDVNVSGFVNSFTGN
jgi:hypothetical protein